MQKKTAVVIGFHIIFGELERFYDYSRHISRTNDLEMGDKNACVLRGPYNLQPTRFGKDFRCFIHAWYRTREFGAYRLTASGVADVSDLLKSAAAAL